MESMTALVPRMTKHTKEDNKKGATTTCARALLQLNLRTLIAKAREARRTQDSLILLRTTHFHSAKENARVLACNDRDCLV